MKLKGGKLMLGEIENGERMNFKNKMATLLCLDGLVYIINDDFLQKCADDIDKLPPQKARARASMLFGSAHCARVGRKNKIYVKDAPEAASVFGDEFGASMISDDICVIFPSGKSESDIVFFADYIKKENC